MLGRLFKRNAASKTQQTGTASGAVSLPDGAGAPMISGAAAAHDVSAPGGSNASGSPAVLPDNHSPPVDLHAAGDRSPDNPPPHHTRRSTVNGDDLVSAAVEPNLLAASLDPAPEYLQGTPLQLYQLKQLLLPRVQGLVFGEGGLRQRFGFQDGEQGGAAAAVEGLVADLTGGGGPVPSPETAIEELHEKVFENYNHWAGMLGAASGAKPVYSLASDPDRDAILASRAAHAEALAQQRKRKRQGRADVNSKAHAEEADATATSGSASTGVAAETEAVDAGSDTPSSTTGPGTGATADAGPDTVAVSIDRVAPEPIVRSSQPGSDVKTRLTDLALFYLIRAEAANLRFMPE
jgi:hypothetical protein